MTPEQNTAQAVNLLMSRTVPSVAFPKKGTKVSGVITRDIELRQQRDIKTKQPAVWRDGTPKMQIVIHMNIGERDPEVEDDTGERALYVRIPGNLRNAISKAIRTAGTDRPEIGGRLTVTYAGDDAPAGPGLDPPKLFVAEYQRPAAGTDGEPVPF
jgi:hypothetical protein